MPTLNCFMCGYAWKSKHKEHNPKVCPSCGNPNWKSPTLAVRFLAAWRAFQNPFLVKTMGRRYAKAYDTDPLATEASLNDVVTQPPTPSTTPVTCTDKDGMPYISRLI